VKVNFDLLKLALIRRLLPQEVRNVLDGRFRRHEQELIYQQMFISACASLGINQVFYPVKGAANYSLLYLILRICLETDVRRILELGAGQTSLLFEQLRKLRADIEVVTIEHDRLWADHIGGLVSHQVIHAPLIDREIRGRRALIYDPSVVSEKFDLILIDGPYGSPTYSRWGALAFLPDRLREDCVLLFDDAERRGEQQTLREAIQILSEHDIRADLSITTASKTQAVLTTRKYSHVRYF
jgi:hypothetical protein